MLGTIARVEEAALDGDKGIVILAVEVSRNRVIGKGQALRFQEAVPMAVDDVYGIGIRNGDVAGLNAYDFA